MPRPRHAGNVAPPQRVAKSVPLGNRTHPAETTWPSASATKIARPAGIGGELLLEGGGVPAFAAVAPGRSLELADPLEINPVADLAQYDTRGSGSAVRQRSCP